MTCEQQDTTKIIFRWNVDDDYYKPLVQIYEDGSLLLCVSGKCVRAPITKWFSKFELMEENILLQKKVEILTKALHAISDHQAFVFKGVGLSTIKHIVDQAIAEVGKK